jgi:hypothetical protein
LKNPIRIFIGIGKAMPETDEYCIYSHGQLFHVPNIMFYSILYFLLHLDELFSGVVSLGDVYILYYALKKDNKQFWCTIFSSLKNWFNELTLLMINI